MNKIATFARYKRLYGLTLVEPYDNDQPACRGVASSGPAGEGAPGVCAAAVLRPHATPASDAWSFEQAETELRRQTTEALRRVLDGRSPRHVVVTPDESTPQEAQ